MDTNTQEIHYAHSTGANSAPPPEFFLAIIPFFALIIFLNWKFFKRWSRMGNALEKIADSLEKIALKLDATNDNKISRE